MKAFSSRIGNPASTAAPPTARSRRIADHLRDSHHCHKPYCDAASFRVAGPIRPDSVGGPARPGFQVAPVALQIRPIVPLDMRWRPIKSTAPSLPPAELRKTLPGNVVRKLHQLQREQLPGWRLCSSGTGCPFTTDRPYACGGTNRGRCRLRREPSPCCAMPPATRSKTVSARNIPALTKNVFKTPCGTRSPRLFCSRMFGDRFKTRKYPRTVRL